jgi:hypothetical protein
MAACVEQGESLGVRSGGGPCKKVCRRQRTWMLPGPQQKPLKQQWILQGPAALVPRVPNCDFRVTPARKSSDHPLDNITSVTVDGGILLTLKVKIYNVAKTVGDGTADTRGIRHNEERSSRINCDRWSGIGVWGVCFCRGSRPTGIDGYAASVDRLLPRWFRRRSLGWERDGT